jgi:hypothetical protein
MKSDGYNYEADTANRGRQMSQIQFERKWVVQCEAARQVKKRFGLANALDYLIGEKLLTFARAAERYAEFSQELPDFLQEIRAVFSIEETSEYAEQLEHTRPFSPLQRHALRAISAASAQMQ